MTKNATQANGGALPATRRAVLFGALASTAALALPVSGAVVDECRHELTTAAEAFRAAHVARADADRNESEARRAFAAALRAEPLTIHTNTFGGSIRLDPGTTADYAIDTIRRDYRERIAAAKRRVDHPMAKVLPTVENLRRDRERLLQRARPVASRYRELERAFRIAEHAAAGGAADRSASATSAVLMQFDPASFAEVRAIANAMHRAGTESGRWYDLPTLGLLAKLAGN